MYIWLIIATFIVTLYSMNLSLRPDMRSLVMGPKAEAVVAQVMVKQRAAVQYATDRISRRSEVGGVREIVVEFNQGRLTKDMFENYLPYGFAANEVGEQYRTAIFCLDRNDLETEVACNSGVAAKIIITYGCIPERWRSVMTGLPNLDLQAALNTRSKAGANFGYTRETLPEDGIATGMIIKGRGHIRVAIPDFIAENDAGMQDSFSEICGTNRGANSCPHCLAYYTIIN